MRPAARIFLRLGIVGLGLGALGVFLVVAPVLWLKFPDHDYSLKQELETADELTIKEELERHVIVLAADIGARNVSRHPLALAAAADYIEKQWTNLGYQVKRQVVPSADGKSHNLSVELPGTTPGLPCVIIGAHYDSYLEAPGANDNASGVATMLVLSRLLKAHPLSWPLRFVAFTNEEAPQYRTGAMGSVVFADSLERSEVASMISLETMGYYTKEADSQLYPTPLDHFYPTVGDFIAIVGDLGSRGLTRQWLEGFRRVTNFPAGAVSLPDFIEGAGWSDHWSFWRKNIPAVMVTDTAPFRYPYYHTTEDTADKLDFRGLARVTMGLAATLRDHRLNLALPRRFTGR